MYTIVLLLCLVVVLMYIVSINTSSAVSKRSCKANACDILDLQIRQLGLNNCRVGTGLYANESNPGNNSDWALESSDESD